MSHFLGAELTEELEKSNENVNVNVNVEPQQEKGTNSQDIDESGNTDVNTTEEELNDEIMKDYEGPEWVNVSRIRRYKASIAAENVEGDTFAKKLTNVNKKISHVDDFMGSKIVYIQNKAHVCAVYGKKVSMEKACDIKLFDDNDFLLTPIQNRGDDEVKDKTVVIRDLPLDVDRLTLKTIMEKVGTVTDIKLQISGLWYKAYVTYENKSTVEEHFQNKWSIFYLKDLCRVAPANVTRQEIDERNRNTLKLTGLPFGTTAYDLNELLVKVNAKTCFIPRTKNQYGRARYAYVTFESEDTCLKMMNNEILGCVNETVLHWIHADVKTCHKCGSMDHLVIECQEKKDNDEFKQRRNGYNKVYTRYRVPNYKNMTKPINNTINKQQEKETNVNVNQKMIEMMQTIQQNIKELNTTMSYLNQRITKIEKQVGIKTPIQTNVSSNTENSGNKNQDSTSQQLQTQSTYGRNNNNENTNVWNKPVNIYNKNTTISRPYNQGNNNNNRQQNDRKRVRIMTSSSSESEAESSALKNKGKNISTQQSQEEKEIDEIKETQQNLGKQVNAISQQMESLISMLNANK